MPAGLYLATEHRKPVEVTYIHFRLSEIFLKTQELIFRYNYRNPTGAPGAAKGKLLSPNKYMTFVNIMICQRL